MNFINRGKIVNDFINKNPPLRVEALVKALGIQIKHVSLPDARSAHLTYDGDKDKYMITVNDSEHTNRKNFSIAHELGHFFLHRDEVKKQKRMDRGPIESASKPEERQREIEANKYASVLLVSNQALDKFLSSIGEEKISVERLSSKFEVSTQVIRIRMKSYRFHNRLLHRKVTGLSA